MNVDVTWNGNNITSHLISYRREQVLCDGIGTLTITLEGDFSSTIDAWDTIILYEDGTKKGTFYVTQTTQNAPSWEITVDCQDGSKRLSDCFINASYFIDYPSYSRYWIERFLQEAGVTYSFTVPDNGVLLSNNTTLGVDFALGILTTLLKQSGWYIYFNADGTAIIGKADIRKSLNLNDNDIIEISLANDDKYLRNRAVVWGGEGYTPGSQVGVAVETTTPWEIDKKDKRSVLYTHSGVKTSGVAYSLAMKLLNEFDTISSEKTVKLIGVYNLVLCDMVHISNRDVYNGTGIITSISSEMSSSGLTTTIILDEKCPRMFGFYSFGDQYVYAGSANSGIYRKPLESSYWEDYSSGLISKQTVDLKVNNGLLVAVMGDGYGYKRDITEAAWSRVSQGNLMDNFHSIFPESATEVVACAIDRDSNDFYFGVRAKGAAICWIVKINSALEIVESYQIMINNDGSLELYDIDTDNTSIYATVKKNNTLINWDNDFYCSYAFTTNGELSTSRTWTSGLYTNVTKPNICNGKVYYAAQSYVLMDYNYLYVIVDDHTNDPTASVIHTRSDRYTLLDYWILTYSFYDQNTDTVYMLINDSSGTYGTDDYEVITYEVSSGTFTSLGIFDLKPIDGVMLGTYISNKNYMLLPYKLYGSLEEFEYEGSCGEVVIGIGRQITIGSLVFDITTLSYTDEVLGNFYILGESIELQEGYQFGISYGESISFDRINFTSFYDTVQRYDPPCDDLCNGLGSFDYEWRYKQYIFWANFSCLTGLFTDYGFILLHPNEDLHYPDGANTVHFTELEVGSVIVGKGSYYGDGPYLYYGFNIEDDGPWRRVDTPNILCPGQLHHFELLGSRDVLNPAIFYGYPKNHYPRTYRLNMSNGEIIKTDDRFLYNINKRSGYFTGNIESVTVGSIIHFIQENGIDNISAFPGNYLYDKTDINDGKILFIELDYLGYLFNYNIILHMLDKSATNILSSYSIGGIDLDISTFIEYDSNENVLWYRKRTISLGVISESLHFFEFSTWNEIIAPSYLTIKELDLEDHKDFIILDSTTTPHQLEISHPGTISTFAYSGVHNDSIRIGFSGGGFHSRMPDNITAAYSGAVNDIRVTRSLTESISRGSGISDLIVAYNNKLSYSNTASGGSWVNVVTASSGIISNVETTNNQVPNAVFYNQYSGASSSGTNKFFQRLSGQTSFVNMSNNIPPTRIRIIRVDDRL